MLTTSTVNPIDITVEVSFFRLSKKSHGKFSLADIILSIYFNLFKIIFTGSDKITCTDSPSPWGKFLNGKKHCNL